MAALLAVGALVAESPTAAVARHHVVWDSPSTNSGGSMPLGNGEVGLNVWVEPSGDLVLYVARTDAWDSHGRLLKLGCVRVRLEPPLLGAGKPFRQELRLNQGAIHIEGGEAGRHASLDVWADAHRNALTIEGQTDVPVVCHASLELWRTQERVLSGEEAESVDRFAANEPPRVYPDTVLPGLTDAVAWYHRNPRSLWQATWDHQGLGKVAGPEGDPLRNRTFGGWLRGDGFTNASSVALATPPRTAFVLKLDTLTAQTATGEEWLRLMGESVSETDRADLTTRRTAHEAWWQQFWERSWVRVSSPPAPSASQSNAGSAQDEGALVTRGYLLQRFINACAGRGRYPIKFNGSLFTVEVPGKFDPDYRRWGGCYWFQNTRLAYWPMLASGDFDLMRPLFRLYREMLPIARERTRTYYGHEGVFFPETFHFWGAYYNGGSGYGWEREGEPVGRSTNRYIRYYWSGGLELVSLWLDYCALTGDEAELKQDLLPMAAEVLEFYARHFPREPNGRILFAPAQALETWWECENPLPEVAGLHYVLDRLLSLPPNLPGPARIEAWRKLRGELPPVPQRTRDEGTFLVAAEQFRNQQNAENPELYAVFPYRLFGLGKPELPVARLTFERRQFKGNRGWQQDDTQAALLGMTQTAKSLLLGRAAAKHEGSRFPAFWGPNFDWVPDQDHGGSLLMSLQSMLLQWDGDRILLFPAWPREWDVEFQLAAPRQTKVRGRLRAGRLEMLETEPPARRAAVEVWLNGNREPLPPIGP
jgi:hypothetical protein